MTKTGAAMRVGRVCLCLGPVLFCLLDGGLTLQGQSEAYWAGAFHQARELNPLGRWPLERHPLLFGAALLCWGCVFCIAILRLPARLARPLSLAVQLGHTLGAASWLVRLGVLGWLLVLPLLYASRLVFDWAWWRSAPVANQPPVKSGSLAVITANAAQDRLTYLP